MVLKKAIVRLEGIELGGTGASTCKRGFVVVVAASSPRACVHGVPHEAQSTPITRGESWPLGCSLRFAMDLLARFPGICETLAEVLAVSGRFIFMSREASRDGCVIAGFNAQQHNTC